MKNKLIFLFAGLGVVGCSADDKTSSQPLFSQEQIEAYQSKAPSDVPYLVMKVNSEGEEEVLYYKGDVSFLDASSKAVDGSAIEIKDYELTPVETNNYLTSDIYGGTSFNNYSSYYKYSPNTYCYRANGAILHTIIKTLTSHTLTTMDMVMATTMLVDIRIKVIIIIFTDHMRRHMLILTRKPMTTI